MKIKSYNKIYRVKTKTLTFEKQVAGDYLFFYIYKKDFVFERV